VFRETSDSLRRFQDSSNKVKDDLSFNFISIKKSILENRQSKNSLNKKFHSLTKKG